MAPSILYRIGITGLGYAGLCTSVCFAERGFDVVGVDVRREAVEALRNGEVPIFETGLREHLRRALSKESLSFSSDYDAMADSEFVFITVGTPSGDDGNIDLSQVTSASRRIAELLPRMTGYPVVVVKSTVVPGTLRRVVKPVLERISRRRVGVDFGLCSNPEFLREGSAIRDTLRPDKVVIGADDNNSRNKLSRLYAKFYGRRPPPMVHTDTSTAELVKYANNAFLAMKVSYINTVARICEGITGSDVKKVAEAIGLDARIGPQFLQAGPGYGGSCFPKDLQALISYCTSSGIEPSIFRATRQVNEEQAKHVVEIAVKMLGNLSGRSISILGLAFKAGTDDIRGSPALRVISRLLRHGAKLRVYDPKAIENARNIFGERLQYAASLRDCVKDSELCIILTGWDEFKRLRPSEFTSLMRTPRVLDARRIYDADKFSKIEFAATGLGR